jgi:transcriptional regulator with XRE-family HTH domain
VESIGDRLRQAREAKKLTIKNVAIDTNMAPTYIEALEDEDFDKFPGETYVIGFLKTYSEYLKLDPDEMVMLYKGYKIGESATPLEELTRPTRPQVITNILALYDRYRNLIFFAGVALVSVLVIWGVWAMNRSDVSIDGSDSVSQIKKSYEESQNSSIKNIKSLQLSNDKGFTLVYKGEAVQFLVENKEVVFLLKEIGENKVTVNFLNDDKDIVIEMDKQVPVTPVECPREVLLTLKGLTESRAKVMIELGRDLKAELNAAAAMTQNSDVKPVTEGDNTRVIAQNNKSLKIVFEVKFIQKSFIEIYLDGNRKQRGFMPAGSVERWEASEYIQMKIGNAGGIKSTINGKEFTFGKPGQVANKIITWKKDVSNPNLYHIDVKDW